MTAIVTQPIWSAGDWGALLAEFEREARRRTRYEPRYEQFIADALVRISVAMAVSIAMTEGLREIEASYRRYLRRRLWVADAIVS